MVETNDSFFAYSDLWYAALNCSFIIFSQTSQHNAQLFEDYYGSFDAKKYFTIHPLY